MNWCEYRLLFRPLGDPLLTGFHGSMMRGAFGHALRKLACVMRRPDCQGCPIEQSCIYTRVFEPRVPPSAGIMAKYPRAPNPFVLVVGSPGQGTNAELHIGIRLFGPAIAQYGLILHAFREAAERGLGTHRQSYHLAEISALGGDSSESEYLPPVVNGAPETAANIVRWHITTPTRLTVAGRPMTPDRIDPAAMAMGLLRRIGLMLSFYGDSAPLPDFQRLKETATNLRLIDSDLHWHELHRRSSRQKATQSVSGLMGHIGIDCTDAPEWRDWLAWGPILHLGKNTSMGLGRLVAA